MKVVIRDNINFYIAKGFSQNFNSYLGSGPCLFCGAIVCTKEEQEVLNRGSKKSEQLRKKLMEIDTNNSGKDKAEAQKNRLLEYDRTSEKRTKVIDDESDYFAVDAYKWMTPEQKSKLKI